MNVVTMLYRTLAVAVLATMLTGCASIGKPSARINDQDSDGVADAQDACQQTVPDTVVDESGCDLFGGQLANLQFKPGDHRLDLDARTSLDELIVNMQAHPDVRIALGGHTDNRGSAADNLELSKRRVMSVVRYLVSNGVDGSRLKPYGFGESRPVVSNATLEGRIQNRRIEVSVIAQ